MILALLYFGASMSHLLQMRGLKRKINKLFSSLASVASFTDAWIETIAVGVPIMGVVVASFTDAWIETIVYALVVIGLWSHLLQMRGLKLL